MFRVFTPPHGIGRIAFKDTHHTVGCSSKGNVRTLLNGGGGYFDNQYFSTLHLSPKRSNVRHSASFLSQRVLSQRVRESLQNLATRRLVHENDVAHHAAQPKVSRSFVFFFFSPCHCAMQRLCACVCVCVCVCLVVFRAWLQNSQIVARLFVCSLL